MIRDREYNDHTQRVTCRRLEKHMMDDLRAKAKIQGR